MTSSLSVCPNLKVSRWGKKVKHSDILSFMDIASIIDWLMGALRIIGWALVILLVLFFSSALVGIFLLRRWLLALRERYVGRDGFLGQVVIPVLGALLWIAGHGMKGTLNKRPDSTPPSPEQRSSNVERTIHDV